MCFNQILDLIRMALDNIFERVCHQYPLTIYPGSTFWKMCANLDLLVIKIRQYYNKPPTISQIFILQWAQNIYDVEFGFLLYFRLFLFETEAIQFYVHGGLQQIQGSLANPLSWYFRKTLSFDSMHAMVEILKQISRQIVWVSLWNLEKNSATLYKYTIFFGRCYCISTSEILFLNWPVSCLNLNFFSFLIVFKK